MNDAASAALALAPDAKRALLARLLQCESRPSGPMPLSFPQRRLWLVDQIERDGAIYNVPFATRLTGDLDVPALERSLSEIVCRHEILRSVIELVDGEPMQVVREAARYSLPIVEATESGGDDGLDAVLARERVQHFDLAREPAFRALLVRIAETDHVLVVTMHHIVTDGWSMGVFEEELGTLYSAYAAATPSPLRPMQRQYADFARFQRANDGSELMERQRSYWRTQLAAAPVSLALPGARNAAARPGTAGASHVRVFAPGLRARVTEMHRANGTTLFSTLLAAFAALVFQSTGNRDIVIGTPFANRTRSEFEEVIGFFINTLPLRIEIAGDPSFVDIARGVHDVALAAFDNGDVSFDCLIAMLEPARRATRTPLVNVMFVLQNAPRGPLHFSGLTAARLERDAVFAKFDLIFEVSETTAGLRAEIVYRTDTFDAAAIADLSARYEALLETVVRQPHTPLSHIASHGEPVGTHRSADGPEDVPLDGRRAHEVFEAQAARIPDRIAVADGNDCLTYAELDRRANRLARYLRSLGAGPKACVGVALARSIETVVAFLAISKTGAAYVPLDPDYPRERLLHVLGDAGIAIVVTRSRFRSALDVPSGVRLVELDCEMARIDALASDGCSSGGDAGDLAYVMFTSGSTGRPKGVLIPHRGIRRLVSDPNYVRIDETDTIAQVATVSFDASTFEIWGALLNGARLEIVSKSVLLEPADFAAKLETAGITILFLTTSLFAEIVREVPAAFSRLRYLLVGGEALRAGPIRTLFGSGPPAHVLNVYGPTEATVFAAYHEIMTYPADGTMIPIGRPISHTELYVLDERLSPVREGDEGQLYIGGPGLALGYLNEPELTRQKFVHDPFASDAKAVLYATGDLVRQLKSGDLVFVGRLDGQRKVRGFRIEPGEIEAVASDHPSVEEVRVVFRDETAGTKIVAYVRTVAPAEFDCSALQRQLRERLPAFMLPDAIVALSSFPISPGGKLDHAALPAPSRQADATSLLAPRNEIEHHIVALWERLLGVRPVGIRDDFFSLGGHSLSAVAMIAEVERAFGRRVPLAVLFDEPTVERVARALVDDSSAFNRFPVVKLNETGTQIPLFFLHGSLNGGGFYCHKLAHHLGWDQPLYLLRPHGVEGNPFPASIRSMAIEYVGLLRELQPHGPYLLGGFCSGGLVAFEMACQLRTAGETVSNVILIDTPAPERLIWPLRFALLRSIATKLYLRARQRTLLAARIARIPHYWRRLKQNPAKLRFLLARLRARSSVSHGDAPAPLLLEWRRVSEAFLPARYRGVVTVLVAETRDARRPERSPWSAVAPAAEVRPLPGNHFSCVTEFIAETAHEITAALARAR